MRTTGYAISRLLAATAVGAVALTATTQVPQTPAPAVPPDVRLSAASVPLGAIPIAFVRNQLVFCSLICPSIVQLATTVPVGVAEAPFAFLGGLSSGSLLKAVGAAAEAVTAPADVATTGIITPDVFVVVPKSIEKTLEIAAVQAIEVAQTVGRPGDFLAAVDTARAKILQALDEPATLPPSDLPTGARGVVEVAAVAAIDITDAVAFQAGELLLAGAVHTVNVAATELAATGDPAAALAAGVTAASAAVAQAGGVVSDALARAGANLQAATHPGQTQPSAPSAAPVTARTVVASHTPVSTERRSASAISAPAGSRAASVVSTPAEKQSAHRLDGVKPSSTKQRDLAHHTGDRDAKKDVEHRGQRHSHQ